MMDQNLKAKWIAALRSGEYKQGISQLHDESTDSYCCLGVLCRVMGAEFESAIQESYDEFGASSFDHVPVLNGRIVSCGDDEELADSFCKEIGILDQGELIKLNDGNASEGDAAYVRPHTFSEIADYIEEKL